MAKAKRRKGATKRKKAGRKTTTVARRGRSTARAPRRSAAVAPGGANVAVHALQSHCDSLIASRAQLDAEIKAVEEALRVMGATHAAKAPRTGAPRGGRRGPRAGSLKEYIARVLSGRGVMSVKDITESVRAAGYPTRNQTLAKSVGITLTKMPEIRRVKRGHFCLK